jgi:hypothetical protein
LDDNIWEYPFGEIDDDDDVFFHRPERGESRLTSRESAAFSKSRAIRIF